MSTSRYRVSRDRHVRFADRSSYLNGRGQSAGAARLCQVLQRFADGINPVAPDSLTVTEWTDFPWLTLVFGSGALDLPEPEDVVSSLAERVEARVTFDADSSFDDDKDEKSASTRAMQFTELLASSRLGRTIGTGGRATVLADLDDTAHSARLDRAADEKPEFVAATKLVLLASVLTEAFHTAQSAVAPPPARWEADIAVLDPGLKDTSSALWRAISNAITLIAELDTMLASVTSITVLEQVRKLLKHIDTPLNKRRGAQLDYQHVRLLTEVAWYFLTFNRPIYAGWTDMLLFLTLSQGDNPTPRSPRPDITDLNLLPDLVGRLYDRPSRASWKNAPQGNESALDASVARRDRVYLAAADVLWEQADASRAHAGRDTGQLPVAAAFVTSFDIELEMALWNSGRGRPYRVVVPVHLAQSDTPTEAELCWLIGEFVSPEGPAAADDMDEAYDRLREPTTWRLLTADYAPEELRETPVVVHLSGCPLFTIPSTVSPETTPDLFDDLENAGLEVAPGDELRHAVTVDEYLAVRQSEVELLWNDESDRKTNRALHHDLITSEVHNPRYWFALGVPVTDAAVRTRLVAQLSRERLKQRQQATTPGSRSESQTTPELDLSGIDGDSPGVPAPRPARTAPRERVRSTPAAPEMSGAAVNTHIGDAAASLLYWAGFDVVHDDVSTFAPDLRHYAKHVAATGPAKKPRANSVCQLENGVSS